MEGYKKIFQSEIPIDPVTDPKLSSLPGLNVLAQKDWLIRDDAYAAQMAYADHLLAVKRADVFAVDAQAEDACEELFKTVLNHTSKDRSYREMQGEITRPDGVSVSLQDDHPLARARRLTQCDFCVLEKRDDEHILTAAALCFPASWTLSEKFMKPMTRIHKPVADYDGNLAKRVQRIFDLIKTDRPMWRANHLNYVDSDLHQPRSESGTRDLTQMAYYERVERQSLYKLPKTGAVIFGIHNYVKELDEPRIAGA